MSHTPLFGILLSNTYIASGTAEPIERYYASMFASYYDCVDGQPGCALVKAIVRGKRHIPRKLLDHYRDSCQPCCPQKLTADLTALADCCFSDAARRNALRHALNSFMQIVPAADAEDLRHMIPSGDLIHLWTYLTWYALCSDHHGKTSY